MFGKRTPVGWEKRISAKPGIKHPAGSSHPSPKRGQGNTAREPVKHQILIFFSFFSQDAELAAKGPAAPPGTLPSPAAGRTVAVPRMGSPSSPRGQLFVAEILENAVKVWELAPLKK